MNEKFQWIFFDVGTTLVDEERAYNHRVYDMIKDTNILFEEFDKKRIELAKQGLDGNRETIQYFNLKKTPWHSEDEILYEDTIDVLSYLVNRGYKLGIIANQKQGLENRLAEFGILKYFDLVIASEEIGVSKPSKEIFEMAVDKVNFNPLECIMIGDRLDNDIFPAKQIGMKTIWMKQGLARYQDKSFAEDKADWIVNSFSELKDIF